MGATGVIGRRVRFRRFVATEEIPGRAVGTVTARPITAFVTVQWDGGDTSTERIDQLDLLHD